MRAAFVSFQFPQILTHFHISFLGEHNLRSAAQPTLAWPFLDSFSKVYKYLQRKIYTNSSSVVLSEEVVHISKNKTV